MSSPSPPASVRAALASLRDLDTLDPVAIREQVTRAIRDVGEGEAAAFWSLGETDGRVVPIRLHAVDVPQVEVYWDALRGTDFADPTLDPRRPKRDSANRFQPAVASGFVRALAETSAYHLLWRRIRLRDQLRGYLYHGGRFLGTLAAGRFEGTTPFGRRDARHLRAILGAVQGALLSAEAAEVRDGAADLVVRPDGTLELASSAAIAWLSMPRFRARVEAVVCALERGDLHGLENLALASVRWVRLHGVGGHVYLLHFAPAAPLAIAPDGTLSRAQRRVAEFLAAGATVRETAHAMGVAPETVRTHLREVYRRLGIGSRAELTRALRSSP